MYRPADMEGRYVSPAGRRADGLLVRPVLSVAEDLVLPANDLDERAVKGRCGRRRAEFPLDQRPRSTS